MNVFNRINMIRLCLLLLVTGVARAEVIDEQFHTTASTTTMLAVLKDYDHLADFVPSLEESEVIGRKLDHIYVKQVGTASFLGFSKTITVILDVKEYDNGLGFRDTLLKDFNFYAGWWEVSPHLVRYHLEALKNFKAPSGISSHVLKKSVRKLMKSVKKEMERREADDK